MLFCAAAAYSLAMILKVDRGSKNYNCALSQSSTLCFASLNTALWKDTTLKCGNID